MKINYYMTNPNLIQDKILLTVKDLGLGGFLQASIKDTCNGGIRVTVFHPSYSDKYQEESLGLSHEDWGSVVKLLQAWIAVKSDRMGK